MEPMVGRTVRGRRRGVRWHRGTFALANTIVAGNRATNAGADIMSLTGVDPQSGHNLLGGLSSMGTVTVPVYGGTIVTVPGAVSGIPWLANGTNGNILTTAPGLDTFGPYGGPTWTFALAAGSPAINRGDDTIRVVTVLTGVNNADQRDVARNGAGSHCDIGAFEMVSTLPTIMGWNVVTNCSQSSCQATYSTSPSPQNGTPVSSKCGTDAWCRVNDGVVQVPHGWSPSALPAPNLDAWDRVRNTPDPHPDPLG